MAKEKILAQVAALLEKFSERLLRVSRETRQNTDAIASLQDSSQLKLAKLQDAIEDGINKPLERQSALNGDRFTKIEKAASELATHAFKTALHVKRLEEESKAREERQAARDQNNVQSLVNLRDSTAKAFTKVAIDVEALMKQVQRLNERVGQVESATKIIAEGLAFERASISTIDQQIVDSKLKGARSYVDTLEKRIQELEAEIALIVAVRKANEAFMRGPDSGRVVLTAVADLSNNDGRG